MGEIRNLNQLLYALKRGYTIQKGAETTAPYLYNLPEQKKEEQHFRISIAGRCIGIDSLYAEVYRLCSDYLCDNEPEIQISISDEDIAYERKVDADEKETFKNSYLETLSVYRKISEALLDYDTFLMHGAVIAQRQNAYMFTAKSGTGKTTHIEKWLQNLDDAYIVNGDKPLIIVAEKDAIACGTPWCGKENLATNCMVPLRAIIFMERGDKNIMQEISSVEAFPFFLQQTYQPDDGEKMKKTLKLISKMMERVKFYRYIFDNMQEDAFDVSYSTLTGGML